MQSFGDEQDAVTGWTDVLGCRPVENQTAPAADGNRHAEAFLAYGTARTLVAQRKVNDGGAHPGEHPEMHHRKQWRDVIDGPDRGEAHGYDREQASYNQGPDVQAHLMPSQ